MHKDYIEIMQYLGASDRTTITGIRSCLGMNHRHVVSLLKDLTRRKWACIVGGGYELTQLGIDMYEKVREK